MIKNLKKLKPSNFQKRFKNDINVGLKFEVPSKEAFEKIVFEKNGVLLNETTNTQVFYDATEKSTKDSQDWYVFGKNDSWLKTVNGQWQLKTPNLVDGVSHVGKDPKTWTPAYKEVFGDKLVRQYLNLPKDSKNSLELDLTTLRKAGPFAEFKATYKTFHLKKTVELSIESASFDYCYGVVKLQIPNADKTQTQQAVMTLKETIELLQLRLVPHVHDLITEYIFRYNPHQFKTLNELKIIRDNKAEIQRFYELEKNKMKRAAKETPAE